MPVGAGILAAGVIGAGATIYGANKAAGTQTQMGQAALGLQAKGMELGQAAYGTSTAAAKPFADFGTSVLPTYASLLDPNSATPTLDKLPGYNFALTQGQRAVTNALTATGLGTSGPLVRGLADYTTGFAANNTFFPYLNAMQQAAGIGTAGAGLMTNAGGILTGAGTNISGNAGNILSGIGNAQAAATMSGANAVGNLANSVPNAMLLSRLLGPGSGSNNALDTMSTNYLDNYQPVNMGQMGSFNPFNSPLGWQ